VRPAVYRMNCLTVRWMARCRTTLRSGDSVESTNWSSLPDATYSSQRGDDRMDNALNRNLILAALLCIDMILKE